ncbi:MAG: DUF4245 domain-containing protein [Candidatus Nanopelagicales bacterium]
MTDSAVAEQDAGRRPDHSPLRKTIRDMSLSMGIIAGIIFAVLLITWRPQPDPVRTIDPQPMARTAAAVAGFPVLLPDVGDGWRATSARFERTDESDDDPVWFNGWVTPDDEFVAVVQSKNGTDDFIDEQTITGLPAVDAPATPGWTAVESSANDQRSLVREVGGVTTIVTGSVEWDQLLAFAGGLKPVPHSGR